MTDRVKPEDKIRCDACPVLCYIADGRSGACDRYANHGGELVRLDPLTIIDQTEEAVPFLETGPDWDGDIVHSTPVTIQGLDRPDERLLGRVVGQVRVTQDGDRRPVHRRMVPYDQEIHCLRVSVPRLLDQNLVRASVSCGFYHG